MNTKTLPLTLKVTLPDAIHKRNHTQRGILLSATVIDGTRNRVKEYLTTRYGEEAARLCMTEFNYWIDCKASTYALRMIVNKKAYQIGRRLHRYMNSPSWDIWNALNDLAGIDRYGYIKKEA